MDAKTFYEQIAPKLDPGGFKLYFTAKRMTGFDLYGQFPYEDARTGMSECMPGMSTGSSKQITYYNYH